LSPSKIATEIEQAKGSKKEDSSERIDTPEKHRYISAGQDNDGCPKIAKLCKRQQQLL
jgi:hypothetical protein